MSRAYNNHDNLPPTTCCCTTSWSVCKDSLSGTTAGPSTRTACPSTRTACPGGHLSSDAVTPFNQLHGSFVEGWNLLCNHTYHHCITLLHPVHVSPVTPLSAIVIQLKLWSVLRGKYTVISFCVLYMYNDACCRQTGVPTQFFFPKNGIMYEA